MNYFFTADTHFGHTNIIKYCNRPFKTIEKHDEILINNWNKIIKSYDIVYHLGDFCFGSKKANEYLSRLNGKIYFIWGNHDAEMTKYQKTIKNKIGVIPKVTFLGDTEEIDVKNRPIVLNHYAMRVWNKSHYGSWHLYGHSHGQLEDDPYSLSIDVGVDCNNYKPFSFEEITYNMSLKLFKPIDREKRHENGGVGLSRDEYRKEQRKNLFDCLKKEFNE